jgi:hypothetical protein
MDSVRFGAQLRAVSAGAPEIGAKSCRSGELYGLLTGHWAGVIVRLASPIRQIGGNWYDLSKHSIGITSF